MTSFVTLSRVIVVGLCLLGATPNASFAFAFQQSSAVARRGFGKAETLRGRKAVILTLYDEELAKLLEKDMSEMTLEEHDELNKVLLKRMDERDRLSKQSRVSRKVTEENPSEPAEENDKKFESLGVGILIFRIMLTEADAFRNMK